MRLEVTGGVASNIVMDVQGKGPLIYVVTKNSTTITGSVLSTQSVTGGSTNINISAVNVGDNTNNFMIGTWLSTTQSWIGDIGEVIVFNRELPDSEKTAIQNYLADKWGIDLL